jgi:prevent-host-death family protein
MLTVNIHAVKTQLARLLDATAAGEEVVIARAGKPVARLVPIEAQPAKRRLGLLDGKLRVSANFDDPLPDDILADFEGR